MAVDIGYLRPLYTWLNVGTELVMFLSFKIHVKFYLKAFIKQQPLSANLLCKRWFFEVKVDICYLGERPELELGDSSVLLQYD